MNKQDFIRVKANKVLLFPVTRIETGDVFEVDGTLCRATAPAYESRLFRGWGIPAVTEDGREVVAGYMPKNHALLVHHRATEGV